MFRPTIVDFLLAWVVPPVALVPVVAIWMYLTAAVDGANPRLFMYLRVGFLFVVGAMLVQLVYGTAVYFLTRSATGWRLLLIVAAYVLPVVLIAAKASDKLTDLVGAIVWVAFALVLSLLTWYLLVFRVSARGGFVVSG